MNTATIRTRQLRSAHGFTLLEMVLSLTVLSVAFAGVASVFVLAGHVMPRPDSAEAASVRQSAALSQVVEDLQLARYITNASANSITFVVPDRTGDQLPDRLTYAWSGTAGDPLTLTVNGSTPVTVAEDVNAFTLACTGTPRTDTVPGQSGTAAEASVFAHASAVSLDDRDVDENKRGIGQILTPSFPAGATTYTMTRIRFRAKKKGGTSGETWVRLYETTGGIPTGSVLSEELLEESDLSDSFEWVEIVFANPPALTPGQPIAVAFEWKSDTDSAVIEFDAGGSDGLLTQDKNSDPWVNSPGQGMLIEVYATYTTSSPTVELTRTICTSADVTLQLGSADAQSATARLFCEPSEDAAAWGASFGASPVGVDFDGDGADWAAQSGGAAGAFADGKWQVDGLIYSQATHNFDEPIVVDLKMGADPANDARAVFRINADQAGGQAIPITVRSGFTDTGQYTVAVNDDVGLGTPRVEALDLGDNPPEVRLLIAPADDAVGVIVNGEPVGSFTYTPVAAGSLLGHIQLWEQGNGFFDEVSVRVGGAAVVALPAGAGAGGGSGGGSGSGGAAGSQSGTSSASQSSGSDGGWGGWFSW